MGVQAGGLAVDITSKQNSHEYGSIRCINITEHQGSSDGYIRDSRNPSEALDFPIDIKARSGVGVYADFGISVGKTGYQRQGHDLREPLFASLDSFPSCWSTDCDECSNVFRMLERCV